ncbi:MAG: hypothetical protein AAF400_01455 [Bacteroidota bacterium]
MMQVRCKIILLFLGLPGYTYAIHETGGTKPNFEQKAREIELYFLDRNTTSPHKFSQSDYFTSRMAVTYAKLWNRLEDHLGLDPARILVRIPNAVLSYTAILSLLHAYEARKPERYDAPSSLTRLIILQHFKYRKLDWRTYGLIPCELFSKENGNDRLEDRLLDFAFWFSACSLFYYLATGGVATIIPHVPWGEVAWLPTYWYDRANGFDHWDNYISYRDKTFLIGLSTSSQERGLFCKTDALYSYKGWILDIEAGAWVAPLLSSEKAWSYLIGVQIKCRLNEEFSLNAACSYKTPDFKGVATDDGYTLTSGITIHY